VSKSLYPNMDGMVDILDLAANVDQHSCSGTVDAIAHVGGLLTGSLTREAIEVIQDELLDTDSEDYDEEYGTGYRAAWKAIYELNLNDLPRQSRGQNN
jgi:hypothetical protein